jgi:hypothetical protein
MERADLDLLVRFGSLLGWIELSLVPVAIVVAGIDAARVHARAPGHVSPVWGYVLAASIAFGALALLLPAAWLLLRRHRLAWPAQLLVLAYVVFREPLVFAAVAGIPMMATSAP